MRVLVVYSNTYPLLNPLPLGASLVAARLRRAGHDVRFVDLMFERDPVTTARAAAIEHRPDLICVSIRNRDNMTPAAYFDPIPQIAGIVEAVRAGTHPPVLLGGTAVTTFPVQLAEATAATWAYCGDDLDPVVRFVDSIAAGAPDLETPGLVYRDAGGRWHENPFTIRGYRGVRFDAFDLIDFKRYQKGYWQAGVVTRTGCPERCTFCDTPHTFGRSFVLRDPDEVADELLELKRSGRARSVFFVDAGFNRPLDYAKQLLATVIRRGAQLTFYAIYDPGQGDAELFSLYRRAGGAAFTVFAESLSDPVLQAMGKSFSATDVERDVAAIHTAGIGTIFTPTFGGPGETRATVAETLGRVAGLRATVVEFSVGLRIQPRTALRERAVAEGLIAADDDCYQPHFYVSPATPIAWIDAQLRAWKWRHPLRQLNMVPFVARMAVDRPWRRGPEG